MRKAQKSILSALVVLATLIAVPASAEGDYVLYGSVQDHAGRPLAGVPVTANETSTRIGGPRQTGSTTTDANGQYRFAWAQPAVYLVQAANLFTKEVEEQSKFAYVQSTTPTRSDFTLFYKIYALGGPISVWAPETKRVELKTWAPSDSLCVTGLDYRTELPLSFDHSGVRADGSHIWLGDLTVEEGAPYGQFSVRLMARDCVSGRYMTYPGRSFTYWVRGDTEPPTIEITRPTQGSVYAMDEEVLSSPDGKTRAVGDLYVEGTAVDVGGLAAERFELYRDGQFEGAEESQGYPAPRESKPYAFFFIDTPGSYELVLKVNDLEGNQSIVTSTFTFGL